MRNWMYEYRRDMIVEDIAKTIRGPEDQHFQEEVVVQWDDILTAEEVAQQNQEMIASLEPKPNARIISSKTFLNGEPYTAKLGRGRNKKAQQGGYAGGNVALGYKVKKGKKAIEVDNRQARTVQRVFELSIHHPDWSLSQLECLRRN